MFTASDVPALGGKLFVITGGNSGIGFEAARVLVQKGGRVVLACRDQKKMAEASAQLRAEASGADVEEVVVDLSSLASIERAAAEIGRRHDHVDVLINNAGVMALPERSTADGFEMQFGTNHLGHFAFTGRLLPLVSKAPNGRVVTVSSLLHRRGRIDFAAIPKPARYDQDKQYAMSKLANLLFTYELHRKLRAASSRAIATACHPGYSATNLQTAGPQMKGSAALGTVMKVMNAVVAQPAAVGALGTLFAATGNVEGAEYLGPTGFMELRGAPVRGRSSRASYDEAVAHRLWDVSEKLTGVTFDLAVGAS